jgi:DNA-binding transcriptional LysR family regulator
MAVRTNLDLDALRTFVLGFELESFARAADRVGRSRSAISSQLHKLEEQVGEPIVRKEGRGLALTDAGESLLSYARSILALNDEALDAVRGAQLDGWVRLGLPQDFAESWLPAVLGRFAKDHPKVRVEVQAEKVSALVQKTLKGELDACLSWGRPAEAAHVQHVADVPIEWIGDETWADRAVCDEAAVPLIAFEPPCAFRDPAVKALDDADIAWRVAFSSPSLFSLWAAAAAGLGITVRTKIGLPANLRVLAPARSGLPALPAVPLTLVRSDKDSSPAVAFLADTLVSVIQRKLAVLR